MSEAKCPRCETEFGIGARFCPNCGCNLSKPPLGSVIAKMGSKGWLMAAVLTLTLFAAGNGLRWYIHWQRGDKRPTEAFVPEQDADRMASAAGAGHAGLERASFEDPELDQLKKEAANDPKDINKQKALAAKFGDLLRANPDAPPAAIFEAIDVLGVILKAAPNDPQALVLMADISFDQKAFPKALEYYERYLKVDPKDLGARSRYASTLTFLERYEEAIKELEGVLKQDPKNFPAKAYLAITYAQKGDNDEALKIADAALAMAPSEEAKARFSGFVDALKSGKAGGPVEESPRGNQPQAGSPAEILDSIVRANPIAGPKFVKAEIAEGSTAKLYFANFPMAQMPPFAKEKFFNGLKEKVKSAGLTDIKKIIFIDSGNGEELSSLDLD